MVAGDHDLKGKIKLILSQVDASATIYTLRTAAPLISALTHAGGRQEIDVAKPGDVEVTNEQLLLLKTLYAQCSPEAKTEFISFLLGEMHEHNARLVVHTVIEIGHISDLKKALDDPKRSGLPFRRNVWNAIREKLTMEPHRFTEEGLTLLEEMRRAELARIPEPRPRPRGIRGLRG